MTKKQIEALDSLRELQEKVAKDWLDYWVQYSGPDVIYFWINLFMFVAPLIYVYFKIDRTKAFHIGFFGFNIHVWFTYIDTFGVRFGFWSYPHQLIPFMPVNFGLDVSLIPVIFMLLYQWTLNNKKNFYLYALAMSLGLSFIFKPYLVVFKMFQFHKGTNYFLLFLAYIVIVGMAIIITKVFIHLKKTATQTEME
ncbi:hypothetical protein N0O92_00320 [Alkalihalobacillus sp. MEB130]|uniref:CBO0543 family protein n=1 Tax=Alkalihalobacillus sp. MEB130 TaxID=2976704 RepID=UPI0028E037D5|nr:CBO0543 family protein [Alkalihalobacillus sp. MEB130]MDT8858652.1 hypothetical protein [Alkalihalobacillus sp. MEB130]